MSYTNGLDNPELYFQCKLYTGNGSSRSITFDGSENMSPNLLWLKSRDNTEWHALHDSVRGATKVLFANDDRDELTTSTHVTSFDSNGFSHGSGTNTNNSGIKMVCWAWKESATAGFDIVTYTGSGSAQNISHSLSAVPEFFPTKRRSGTNQWRTYHVGASSSATNYGNLDQVDPFSASTSIFNDTMPTSSVYTVGSDSGINGSSETYVSYLWCGKQGYSRFSKYQGNGSATNGEFIYTGFRPALIITKSSSTSGTNWLMMDNKRHSVAPASGKTNFNVINRQLMPNLSNADDTNENIDFLSNGFKWYRDGGDSNASGRTYVYAAWAESPLVNSNGVPCNAR